jgi:hypothetical protein
LANREVQKHAPSKRELDEIRALIERDLADAALPGLSADRRFATAYNAALQTCKMAIASAGYRVASGAGHHKTSFEAVKLAMASTADAYADYFDTCRRKRNILEYTSSHVATQTEAEELVQKAIEFREFVERWIETNHPALKA